MPFNTPVNAVATHTYIDAQYKFGPWPIAASEVFLRTQLSFAFVNLKPLVPGAWVDGWVNPVTCSGICPGATLPGATLPVVSIPLSASEWG
jgi:hypothetical protein